MVVVSVEVERVVMVGITAIHVVVPVEMERAVVVGITAVCAGGAS